MLNDFLGFFNKSVFTKDTYRHAIREGNQNGYAVIKIKPMRKRVGSTIDDYQIIGIIQDDGLSLSMQADWQEGGGLGDLVPSIGFLQKMDDIQGTASDVARLAGFQNIGAVYASRKIYHSNSDIKISPKLKVVNWKNNGAPIKSAIALFSLCIPSHVSEEVINQYKLFVQRCAKGVENVVDKNLPEPIGEAVEGMESGITKIAEKAIDIGKAGLDIITNAADTALPGSVGGIQQNVLEDILDNFQVKSSPVPVRVEIGRFFARDDMVITGVTCNFSREMTISGPLFVDIDLEIASRTVVRDINDLGLQTSYGIQRVFQIN